MQQLSLLLGQAFLSPENTPRVLAPCPTVVLLAGVASGGPAVTLWAVIAVHPPGALSPQYEPPTAGRALQVWLGLLFLVAGSWIGLRLWLSGQRTQRRRGVVRKARWLSGWATGVCGVVLIVLTVRYPSVWWTLLLWMLAAGAVVGDAREQRIHR